MISIVDGEYSHGIGFTDPEPGIVHKLSFEAKEFDYTVPTEIMFADCNGVILKFDYSVEYNDTSFEIEVNGKSFTGTFSVCETYNNPVMMVAK